MDQTNSKLSKLIAGRNTPQKVVLRASIVLSYLNGQKKADIARSLSTSRPTIDVWVNRFKTEGVQSLLVDKSRPGRKKSISDELEKQN